MAVVDVSPFFGVHSIRYRSAKAPSAGNGLKLMYCPVVPMAVASTALHDTNSSKKRMVVHVGPHSVAVLEENGVKPKHSPPKDRPSPRQSPSSYMHDCVREER